MARRSGRLSYANLMSTVAVFVALGGASYAAVTLPANSVTTKQVKNGTLLSKDFKAGQLPRGATGPIGPVGLAGPAGAKGDRGDTGAGGAQGNQGIQGIQGLQGGVGPTWGTALTEYAVTVTPQELLTPEAVDLPTAGKVLMAWSGSVGAVCASDLSPTFWALFVDGNQIPGSSEHLGQDAQFMTLYGVTGALTAGTHTFSLGVECNGSDWSSSDPKLVHMAFTLLGS